MRIKAAFVFILTALLYSFTLASSSYVGVYATYTALPILLVSGYIMLFGRKNTKSTVKTSSLLTESMNAVSGLLEGFNEAMDGVNNDLARINRKNELKRERMTKERASERALRLQRVEWDAHLRYASDEDQKNKARRELEEVDRQLTTLRETMAAIEKQCEIDAIQEQRARLKGN